MELIWQILNNQAMRTKKNANAGEKLGIKLLKITMFNCVSVSIFL
jgi:hypothetical protein